MARIVLVDDNEDLLATMTEALTLNGHEVFTASDGLKAFELVNQQNPKLLITDILMPNEDGIGLLLSLEKDGSLPCKIIVISGAKHDRTNVYLDIVMELGVDAVVKKPFKLAQLLEIINSVILDCSPPTL